MDEEIDVKTEDIKVVNRDTDEAGYDRKQKLINLPTGTPLFSAEQIAFAKDVLNDEDFTQVIASAPIDNPTRLKELFRLSSKIVLQHQQAPGFTTTLAHEYDHSTSDYSGERPEKMYQPGVLYDYLTLSEACAIARELNVASLENIERYRAVLARRVINSFIYLTDSKRSSNYVEALKLVLNDNEKVQLSDGRLDSSQGLSTSELVERLLKAFSIDNSSELAAQLSQKNEHLRSLKLKIVDEAK